MSSHVCIKRGKLNNIWRSRTYFVKTKLHLFNANVYSVLLYGCQTWLATKSVTHSLQVFVNRCLRKILSIFWPNTISNQDLWQRTHQLPIDLEIKSSQWEWLGHVLRRPRCDIARAALDWNPQGSRGRGRPRILWRRTILREAEQASKS